MTAKTMTLEEANKIAQARIQELEQQLATATEREKAWKDAVTQLLDAMHTLGGGIDSVKAVKKLEALQQGGETDE